MPYANNIVLKGGSILILCTRRYVMYDVKVDDEKCVSCSECVDICPEEVFELHGEKSVPVNAEDCVGCESCVELCEEEAITVIEI